MRTLKYTGLFALFNFLLFLFSNAINTIESNFASSLMQTVAELFINYTPLAVAVVSTAISDDRLKSAALISLPLSTTLIIRAIPVGYLRFYAGGYDTPDSLLLATITSLLSVIICYTLSLLILAVFYLFKKGSPKGSEPFVRSKLFDFSRPYSVAVLSAALVIFLYSFIIEIVDTVAFMKSHFYSFTPKEILSIMLSYLVLFVHLVISYILVRLLDRFVRKNII